MLSKYSLVETTVKKSLVRIGPGVFYDPVACLPMGLPKGTKVGIDKEANGWLRMIGTEWWITKKCVHWL